MPVSKLLVRHTDHNRILGIEQELACNRGSCGGISMKRDLRHSHLKRLPSLTSVSSEFQFATEQRNMVY